MISFDQTAAAERLADAFSAVIAETPYGGAALAVWQEGKPILSLCGGEASPGIPWIASTPCLIWSASKGIAAACALRALQSSADLRCPVGALLRDFECNGKEQITFLDLLSHRAGLAAIDQKGLSLTDHEAVISALNAQPPNWMFDGSHGYGARTFGFLLDEIIRWITNDVTLAEYWEHIFRVPLGLDIWFGVPEEKLPEVATMIAPKTPPVPSDFSRAFGDPASLTRRSLSEPNSKLGTLTPSVMNTQEMRMAAIPSLGVIATADSLARFYAILAGGGGGFFLPETLTAMQTTVSKGLDRVLMEQTCFSAGFMTNDFGVYGPSKSAFGHPGAGGSLGFADPELGLGFAFIPSAMNPGALPGPRTQKLVRALYGITA